MVGATRRTWRIFEDIPEDSSTGIMMERAGFGSNYASSDGDTDIPLPPAGLQRQISRSEPHLNIPRFHIGQTAGDGEEALSRAMSGLFGADSDYHVPASTPLDRSTNDLYPTGDLPSTSNRGFLTVGGGQQLRKSASAVDQRSLLLPSYANASGNETNAMVAGNQQPDSLLRVSSTSGITPANSPMLANKNHPPAHSQTASLVEQAAALQPLQRANNSFSNFFGRGFFAKPVMGNQEESYRYIMALDR